MIARSRTAGDGQRLPIRLVASVAALLCFCAWAVAGGSPATASSERSSSPLAPLENARKVRTAPVQRDFVLPGKEVAAGSGYPGGVLFGMSEQETLSGFGEPRRVRTAPVSTVPNPQ